MNLDPLLKPRSIAVVGASEKSGAGSIVLDNLRRLGFPGRVYPINPKYDELCGWRCYDQLAAVPDHIDLVATLVSAGRALPVLAEAVRLGAGSAWILASGFGEAGPEGAALQAELVRFSRTHDFPVCGPNCVGFANLHAQAAGYSVALPTDISKGHVGAIVQSGAVCLGIANSNRGLGFSTLISSGNEAVLDNADYISYLVDDPETRVILAFIEGFKSPARFELAAERARLTHKPLLVVKVGRSEVAQRATLAHTGSLAGSDAVHDAMFRRHGVVRLDNLDELLEAAELFLKAPMPAGNGVAFLTLSGGQIGLIGDQMQGLGLCLPELSDRAKSALAKVLPSFSAIGNPLDAWGAGNFEETYPACMHILAGEPAIDLIAISRDSSPGIAPQEIRQSKVIIDAAAEMVAVSGKPMVVFSNIANGIDPAVKRHADDLGLPILQGTRASLRAIQELHRYAEIQRCFPRSVGARPVSAQAVDELRLELTGQPTTLTENVAKRFLVAYGIRATHEVVARSAEEAVSLASEFQGPVALKIVSPDIPHKTDAGCVLLNLEGGNDISNGFATVLRNAITYRSDAKIEGVLVQEMAPKDAVEVIIGSNYDPEFGPVVVFGLGGIFVELLKESSLRMAPVSSDEAIEMIESTRGAAILRGHRGRPQADVAALADSICRLSHLAYDL